MKESGNIRLSDIRLIRSPPVRQLRKVGNRNLARTPDFPLGLFLVRNVIELFLHVFTTKKPFQFLCQRLDTFLFLFLVSFFPVLVINIMCYENRKE